MMYVVVYNTYCFDLDISLICHKQLRFFSLFTMDAQLDAGEFDSIGVTLFQKTGGGGGF